MCIMHYAHRALQVDMLQRRRNMATGEDRETQRALAPEEEGRGRRVQRSQLRLAPPNRIPFI